MFHFFVDKETADGYTKVVPQMRNGLEGDMIELTVEQARKVSGISQKEMAKVLHISENAYINKEKGISRFYVDEACKFAEAVNLPLETIKFF